MGNMPGWLKIALVVVVSGTVLYVLISPLPELDAADAMRSVLPSASFDFCAALIFFLLSYSCSLAASPLSSAGDILKKNCARLC